MNNSLTIALMLMATICSSALAGVVSNAARETAEYVLKRFGKEVGEETLDTLAEKIGSYGAKYGDEAINAIRKTGPRGFKLLDDAGENAPEVLRLLNRYGNEAVWVASKPGNLAIFVKYGDEAAEAMIKHPGIAEPIVEKFGLSAAKALRTVSGQNARRLGMMVDDGSLKVTGKADDLLNIVGRHGDRAADWVWRNKGSLAVATVATAFVTDPEPFLNGSVEIVKVGGEAIVRPAAKQVAESINWNLFLVLAIAGLVVLVTFRFGWRWLILSRKGFDTGSPGGISQDKDLQ